MYINFVTVVHLDIKEDLFLYNKKNMHVFILIVLIVKIFSNKLRLFCNVFKMFNSQIIPSFEIYDIRLNPVMKD